MDISNAQGALGVISHCITTLSAQNKRLQAQLDAKTAEIEKLRRELKKTKEHLECARETVNRLMKKSD